MRINKLNQPQLLLSKLQYSLSNFGIELYDVDHPSKTSVKFRARRLFNKDYCGGGMKYGSPIGNSFGYHGTIRQASHLHWEQWAIINDLINDICDTYELGGCIKSQVDGCQQWVRIKGKREWNSELTKDDTDDLLLEAQKHISKASQHYCM